MSRCFGPPLEVIEVASPCRAHVHPEEGQNHVPHARGGRNCRLISPSKGSLWRIPCGLLNVWLSPRPSTKQASCFEIRRQHIPIHTCKSNKVANPRNWLYPGKLGQLTNTSGSLFLRLQGRLSGLTMLAFAARSMIDRERKTLEKGIGFTGN